MEKKQDKYLKVEIIGRLEIAEIITKKNSFEEYAIIRMKQIKDFSEDIYQQGYNIFNIVIPSDTYQKIGRDVLSSFIGQEVKAKVDINNYIKKIANKEGEIFYVNNTSYYLLEIEPFNNKK
jgi:hypothetical protein